MVLLFGRSINFAQVSKLELVLLTFVKFIQITLRRKEIIKCLNKAD